MSIQATLGSTIQHEGKAVHVVRIVHSSTLFESIEGCYVLEERYAECRSPDSSTPIFHLFEEHKHPVEKIHLVKGLDPSIWRRF